MSWYVRFRNILHILNLLKGKYDDRISPSYLRRYITSIEDNVYYKNFKKGCFERDLIAAGLKYLRKRFPYQIQGWTEAQKMYERYFEREDSIKRFEDLYEGGFVVKFSKNYPVKGKKEFEYDINYSIRVGRELPWTTKIGSLDKQHNCFDIDNGDYLNKTNMTAFRWATKEEIKVYEEEHHRKEKIQEKIDELEEEITELNKKL